MQPLSSIAITYEEEKRVESEMEKIDKKKRKRKRSSSSCVAEKLAEAPKYYRPRRRKQAAKKGFSQYLVPVLMAVLH